MMTYDEFIEKAISVDQHYKYQQAQKALARAYSVLTDDDSMLELIDVKDAIKKEKEELFNIQTNIEALKTSRDGFIKARMDKIDALNKEIEKLDKVKKNLDEESLKLETKKARDAFRLAEYYKLNVKINNEYQNTEYIKGLARVLQGSGETDDSDDD